MVEYFMFAEKNVIAKPNCKCNLSLYTDITPSCLLVVDCGFYMLIG